MDFRNRDNPDIEALLTEARNRGMFTGTIEMEDNHLHVEFDDVVPMDFSDEGQPLPQAMQPRSPVAGNQANAGAWNTLSPQQKEQSRASYNGVLSAAWGTPNQGAIAADILGRMPPGSRLYYPQGSDKPVVISEYDLRTQGLPAGGTHIRSVSDTAEQTAMQQRWQANNNIGMTSERSVPGNLQQSRRTHLSNEAYRRGAPARAAAVVTRRRADQAELLRLQGLLDNPVVPSAVSPAPPLVTLDQSSYELSVNQALLDATVMTSDTGDTSSQ